MKPIMNFFAKLIFAVTAMLMVLSTAIAADWGVVKSAGQVHIFNGKKWVPIKKGMKFRTGETLRAGKNGRAVLRRGAEAIAIGPGAILKLPRSGNGGGKTVVHQVAGSANYKVQKRNVKHFAVQTPYLAAVVKGTQFNVAVGRRSSQVSVRNGVVEVGDFDTGQFANLRRGQSASTSNSARAGLRLKNAKPSAIQKRRTVASPVGATVAKVRRELKKSLPSVSASGEPASGQEKAKQTSTGDASKPVRKWNQSGGFKGSGYAAVKQQIKRQNTQQNNARVASASANASANGNRGSAVSNNSASVAATGNQNSAGAGSSNFNNSNAGSTNALNSNGANGNAAATSNSDREALEEQLRQFLAALSAAAKKALEEARDNHNNNNNDDQSASNDAGSNGNSGNGNSNNNGNGNSNGNNGNANGNGVSNGNGNGNGNNGNGNGNGGSNNENG